MKVFPSEAGCLVRLVRGEEIHESLVTLATDRGWRGGAVTGIGAVEDAVLGFYHLDQREYERRSVPERAELVSLLGNLCLLEGRPFLHAHATLMTADFVLTGGHLFSAKVTATVEIAVTQTDLHLVRRADDTIGLPLLERGGLG